MKVFKFGGTSVGSAERIKNVAKLVNDGERKIVVLSAMSGTTNSLVEIADYYSKNNKDGATEVINSLEAKYQGVINELFASEEYKKKGLTAIKKNFELLRSFNPEKFGVDETKEILAQGELMSTQLFHLHNLEIGVKTVLISALDYMRINKDGEPNIEYITEKLLPLLKEDAVFYITQGFICLNERNKIDNLKRGGSDYSASLVGAGIKSEEVQIWTDIDGVHNNDPRFVKGTYPIPHLSFDEAAELAYFGAKILHPLSVLPAKQCNIPVILKNTLEPSAPGTTISNTTSGKGIKAVAAKDGITAIKIKSGRMLLAYGFLRKVFEIFEKYKTPIDMITTSEVAVSVTIDDTGFLKNIIGELKELGAVTVDDNQTIICVVGNMIGEERGCTSDILSAVSSIPVRMISFGGSQHNISILIDTKNKIEALNLLNDKLFKK